MGLFDRILERLERKKKNREEGNYNMLPFSFPRYNEYFDGFSPGDYIGLLGMTGSGKSKLVRQWMYDMVDFAMRTSYKTKILYFSLEDPEIPVGVKILSHYLWKRHGISASGKMLNSREHPLPDKYINIIKSDELFWRKFYSIVEIYNNLSSPNQIRDKIAEVYKEFGKEYHIVVIIDNQSNITADPEDDNEWTAIKRLSRDIIRLKLCPAGITTITVLQTDFDTEKNTFRNTGKAGLINIEPNLSSIGDAKVVARAMHYVFALFDPNRFEIKEYPFAGAYNIDVLRGKFRALLQLKSNEGEIAARFGLLFDGLHETFKEMPPVTEKEELTQLYNKILLEQRQKIERLNGKIQF